jgi:hypothetical protein
MYSDINFIRATDGKVNAMRADYPFGIVGTATSYRLTVLNLEVLLHPDIQGLFLNLLMNLKGMLRV